MTPEAHATRTLWLLRHAKAVADPPPGGDDFDRVLAPRGRRDASALGALIGPDGGGLGVGAVDLPQVAFVSPAARTAATAELVLHHVGVAHLTSPAGLYGAEPDAVLDYLRSVDDAMESALVVGHNPTIHALARGLLSKHDTSGNDDVVRRGFPTCALGIYRLGIERWADIGAGCATLVGLFIPPFDRG